MMPPPTGIGSLIRVDRERWRVWVCGYRCHHGLVGVALVGAGLLVSSPAGAVLFMAGVACVVDDWPDRPWAPARLAA